MSVTARAVGRAPIVNNYTIESGGRSAFNWFEQSLDLTSLAGEEVEFEFEYSTVGPVDGLVALSTPRLVRPSPDPKHVVLITSDTHRADYVGFSGSDVDVRTPFLDVLAKSGVVFEDCAASANVTNPSHVALMTGTHPVQTGVVGNAISAMGNTRLRLRSHRSWLLVRFRSCQKKAKAPKKKRASRGMGTVNVVSTNGKLIGKGGTSKMVPKYCWR